MYFFLECADNKFIQILGELRVNGNLSRPRWEFIEWILLRKRPRNIGLAFKLSRYARRSPLKNQLRSITICSVKLLRTSRSNVSVLQFALKQP